LQLVVDYLGSTEDICKSVKSWVENDKLPQAADCSWCPFSQHCSFNHAHRRFITNA
jgi:hypothetical protein